MPLIFEEFKCPTFIFFKKKLTKNYVAIFEIQTSVCTKIFLKRFQEAMIGHWILGALSLNETIKKGIHPKLFCAIMFLLEQNFFFKSWQKLRFKVYVFNLVFGCLTRIAFIKWNSFKHRFNQETFHTFWDFLQATHLGGPVIFPLEGNLFKLQFNALGTVFISFIRSSFILKWNPFKHSFNQETFYDF